VFILKCQPIAHNSAKTPYFLKINDSYNNIMIKKIGVTQTTQSENELFIQHNPYSYNL
jgi:hypothetical protein